MASSTPSLEAVIIRIRIGRIGRRRWIGIRHKIGRSRVSSHEWSAIAVTAACRYARGYAGLGTIVNTVIVGIRVQRIGFVAIVQQTVLTNDFSAIAESVVVAVGIQGIGIIGIDDAVVAYLGTIIDTVVVRVRIIRIGTQYGFLRIAQAIGVGIGCGVIIAIAEHRACTIGQYLRTVLSAAVIGVRIQRIGSANACQRSG